MAWACRHSSSTVRLREDPDNPLTKVGAHVGPKLGVFGLGGLEVKVRKCDTDKTDSDRPGRSMYNKTTTRKSQPTRLFSSIRLKH